MTDLTAGYGALTNPNDMAGFARGFAQREGKIKQAEDERTEALKGPTAEAYKALSQPRPEVPETPSLPDAPQPNFSEGAQQWVATAAILSGLAGALTRRHMTNALTAFSGAIQGFRKGKIDQYDQNYKTWKAETDKAVKETETLYKKYEAILADNKDNIDVAMAKVKLAATVADDKLAAASADLKRFTDFGVTMQTMQSNILRMKELTANIADKHTQIEQKSFEKWGMPWEDVVKLQSDFNKLPAPPGETPSQKAQRFQQWSGIGAGGTGGLTPSGLAYGVSVFRTTGQIPAGFGGKEMRTAIVNEAGRQAQEEGQTGIDDILKRSDLKANQASLTKLVGMKNAVESFENTAQANLDILSQMGQQVDQTGVPVVEQWIRAGRQAGGSVAVNNFNAQMQLVKPEIAKIMTNPNLTGVLTDTARAEVAGFLSPGASAEQIIGLAPLLKGDFDRRDRGLTNQIELIRSQITGRAPMSATPERITPSRSSGISPEASQYLRDHPDLRDAFDQKYGAGAAAAVLGQ